MGRSMLEKMFSVKNFPNGNNNPKPKTQKNLAPKKVRVIFRRKITNKPCNTNPKAKPIDN